jgi:hypothetical protein
MGILALIENEHEQEHDQYHRQAVSHALAIGQKLFEVLQQSGDRMFRFYMTGNVIKSHYGETQQHDRHGNGDKTHRHQQKIGRHHVGRDAANDEISGIIGGKDRPIDAVRRIALAQRVEKSRGRRGAGGKTGRGVGHGYLIVESEFRYSPRIMMAQDLGVVKSFMNF